MSWRHFIAQVATTVRETRHSNHDRKGSIDDDHNVVIRVQIIENIVVVAVAVILFYVWHSFSE